MFPKIDDFVELIKAKFMFKLDIRRAYRQISICPSSYNLVGFKWKNHIFFDTVLAMGLRSSAHICQRVTNAFAFIDLVFSFAITQMIFVGLRKKSMLNLHYYYLCLPLFDIFLSFLSFIVSFASFRFLCGWYYYCCCGCFPTIHPRTGYIFV